MYPIVKLTLDVASLLLFVLLAHRKIGWYPLTLPKSESPLRELAEAFAMWGIIFVSILYAVVATYVRDIYYPLLKWGGVFLPLHFVLMLIIPLVIEVFIRKRGRSELGFRVPIAWAPALVCIGFGIFSGVLAYVFERPGPYPEIKLLLGLITPVFIEEWVYRSVLQSKIERALGQNRAWIISGLLFAVSHIPMNFFGPLWINSGGSVVIALLALLGQCASGWLWGILYIKTRSIFPGIISHYCSNFLLGILPYFVNM